MSEFDNETREYLEDYHWPDQRDQEIADLRKQLEATMSTPEKREVHPLTFVNPVEMIELPVQLHGGTWIKLSDIVSVVCNGTQEIEVLTRHKAIRIRMVHKEAAQKYAKELGDRWCQSIIDTSKQKAFARTLRAKSASQPTPEE